MPIGLVEEEDNMTDALSIMKAQPCGGAKIGTYGGNLLRLARLGEILWAKGIRKLVRREAAHIFSMTSMGCDNRFSPT